MRLLTTVVLLLLCGSLSASDLTKVDRTIKKEPKYTHSPKYALLVFGADARHCVWLIQDGPTLYVDRDGNGDLTESDDKVSAGKAAANDSGFDFEVGELRVGGKTHKGLHVRLAPLHSLSSNPNLMAMPQVSSVVKKHPNEMTGYLTLDVECELLKGAGIGGRVSYMISLFDLNGVLQLAGKPADAPILHFDGPLEITFYGSKPTWTGGRSADTILCLGTPGHGPGTFAMVKYEGTVPADKHPKLDVTYRPKDSTQKPVKELYELKERC